MTVQAHTVGSDIFDDIPNALCLSFAMTLKLHGSLFGSFSVHFFKHYSDHSDGT